MISFESLIEHFDPLRSKVGIKALHQGNRSIIRVMWDPATLGGDTRIGRLHLIYPDAEPRILAVSLGQVDGTLDKGTWTWKFREETLNHSLMKRLHYFPKRDPWDEDPFAL